MINESWGNQIYQDVRAKGEISLPRNGNGERGGQFYLLAVLFVSVFECLCFCCAPVAVALLVN